MDSVPEPEEDKAGVAQGAVENLNANDLKSLRREAFPQDSGDRRLGLHRQRHAGNRRQNVCRVAMRWCASQNWARVGLVGGEVQVELERVGAAVQGGA